MSDTTTPWEGDGAGGAQTDAQLAWGAADEPEPEAEQRYAATEKALERLYRPARRVPWPLVLSVAVAMVTCGTATALAITAGHRTPTTPSPPAVAPPVTVTTTAPPVTATVTAAPPQPVKTADPVIASPIQGSKVVAIPGLAPVTIPVVPPGPYTPYTPAATRPPLPPHVCWDARGMPIPVPVPGYPGPQVPCAESDG